MTTVLVGVDGSAGSVESLRWALREAKLRGDDVDVVHCWHLPYVSDPTGLAVYPMDQLRECADALLADVMRQVDDAVDGLTVTSRAIIGPAAATLIEASAHADLLVVGRRGHGGFLTLLMGSVAQQVAAHSRCPVVIVAVE